jgi:hypothetical protein
MTFTILMAVTVRTAAFFCDVTQYRFVDRNQRFGATYGFYVQGTTLKKFFCTDDGVNVEIDIHAVVLSCTTRSFTPQLQATVRKEETKCSTTRTWPLTETRNRKCPYTRHMLKYAQHWLLNTYLQSSYSGSSVFCFHIFQQTGNAGGHLVSI